MDPIDNELAVKYDTSLGNIKGFYGSGGMDVDEGKTQSGANSTTLEGKDVLDLVGKKVNPLKKVEKKIKDKFEHSRDSLVESLFEDSNVKRTERLASAEPAPVMKKATTMLNNLTNASGKAQGSADSFIEGSAKKLISHLEKSSSTTRELLESGGDMARAIVGGTKNSKNLRLAGAATLFAAAGYGIGKVKENAKGMRKRQEEIDPDQEQRLRQSLLNDG